MDSNTFTCPDCERTLPLDAKADGRQICTECHAATTETDSTDDDAEHGHDPDSGGTIVDPSTDATRHADARDTYDEPEGTGYDDETEGMRRRNDKFEGTDRGDDDTPGAASEPATTADGPEADAPTDESATTEGAVFWDSTPDVELRAVDHTTQSVPDSERPRRDDALDRKVDSWKEQLLDLTRRNTLIDFTETKTKSLPFAAVNPPGVAAALRNGDLHIHKQPADADAGSVSLSDQEVLATRSPDVTTESLYRIGLNEKQFLRERGVDTLYLVLGMVRWYAPDEPNDPYESPLFLAPVDLEQTPGAGRDRHNYVISAADDELLLNPALRKKLSSEFRLDLPADDALGLECIDAAFQAVHDDIEGFDDWTLQRDVVLGVFDFAKYSIYTDLEQNRDVIRDDPFIQALNDDPSALLDAEADIEPLAPTEIDDRVDPDDVYQVLDADSSQQAAIEAAKRGRSFVIQGPPGTGKSQTIANIIAEKLAAGETVLFVSEKQAALNVVKDRLDDVGIGRFCLEAHGRKASKSNVLESLGAELQSNPVKDVPERAAKLADLEQQRATLNEYGAELLEAPDGFAVTPYEAFGLVAKHRDVPRIDIDVESPLALDQEALDAAHDALTELAYFETELETYHSHPWRHTTVTQWRVDTGEAVTQCIAAHVDAVEALADTATTVEDALGITVESCTQMEDAASLLTHLERQPDVEWHAHHFSEAFRALDARLEEFATHMERIETLRSDLLEHYEESIFGADGQQVHTAISGYGALRFLRPGYYSIRNQIQSHATPSYDPSFTELVDDARKLMEVQQRQDDVESFTSVESALGPLYTGAATDWDALLETHAWVTALYEFPFDPSSIAEALVDGTLPAIEPLGSEVTAALDSFGETDAAFRDIMAVDAITVDDQHLYDAPFVDTTAYLRDLGNRVDALEGWVEFSGHLESLQDTIAAGYVERFLNGSYDVDVLVSAFEKRFFTEWLNEVYDESVLGSFNADTFSKYLADFRRLDQEQQELAKVAIQHLVTRQRPQLDLEHADSSEQVILRREIQKQRQHKPLRELFDDAGEFITTLKPCFMMSPLSVAQFLKADAIEFDTVIFDEASQVMPEDAVSSIIRADQAIIAGDTKQLPPTQFFDTDVEVAAGVRDDLDSILEEAAAILPEVRLTWHYRSRSAELIEFSNQLYYNGQLQTFPENDPDTKTGVEFEYVPDGVYDRGGTRRNDVEAERVVDLVTHHATMHPEKSLGVVAFSVAQEEAIRDALEARRQTDETLDRFIDEDDILGEFFVKNLEMVQGDERDRMLFSVGYGPDDAGDVTMNFGPLNQQGGERRLNVAVTRARERVTVVSSIRPDEIDLSRTSSTGVEHFKRYLEYARDDRTVLSTSADSSEGPELESALEQSVYDTLTARGHTVDVVSSSGYSVDLAVKASPDHSCYQVGIEFDGSAYRWSNTARDRDRIRPSVLEALGWNVQRLWAPDWVSNRDRVLADLEAHLDADTHRSTNGSGEIDAIDVATYEPEEYSRAELEALQQEVGTYRDPSPAATRDTSFDDASPDALQQALYSCVLEYGPIHRDVAFRSIAAAFGEPRRTPTVEETLDTQLLALKHDGRLYSVDEFLWPQRQDLSLVVRQNDSDSRSIDRIPREEIGLAIALILDAGVSMTRDDLVVETARLFGYDRVGTRIRDRIEDTIEWLQRDGFVDDTDHLTLQASRDAVRDAIIESIYA